MEYLDFTSLIEDIKSLNNQQNYWMVRTMGGAYYREFVRGGYIAVGYNNITLADLNHLPESDNLAKEALKIKFNNQYPDIPFYWSFPSSYWYCCRRNV